MGDRQHNHTRRDVYRYCREEGMPRLQALLGAVMIPGMIGPDSNLKLAERGKWRDETRD